MSQVKVGDQVPGDNPTGERDTEFGDTVDSPQWRKLVLLASKKDGSSADVELLRPLWWLEEQHAQVGGSVEINVPECGIEGRAKVLAIEPCPPIKHDSRLRIVTGTFKHKASKVLDVYVEGVDEPIGTTPNHPFWSVDRQSFVRADELREGERLHAFNGTPIIRRIVPLADPEPVFNLEVQCDHVYYIASSGLLVHNSNPCVVWMDLDQIMFSQSSVNKNVLNTVEKMENLNAGLRGSNTWDWSRSDAPLNVVIRPNGTVVSLDNRRLLASHFTGQKRIPVYIRDANETLPIPGARRTFGEKLNERLRQNGLGGDGTSQLPAIEF